MNANGRILTNDEWDELFAVADRFEMAWRVSSEVEIDKFLVSADSPLRLPLLLELIKTELEIRCRKQLPVELETYLSRYAELGKREELPVALIYEEYRARSLYGDRPRVETYRTRFPHQFEALRRLLREQPVRVPAPQTIPPTVAPTTQDHGHLVPRPQERLGPPPSSGALPALNQLLPMEEQYAILSRLGGGRFGEVFRGRAPGGGEVALKRIFRTLDDEGTRRERAALDLIQSLHHPALVHIQKAWTLPDRLVLAMDLADDNVLHWLRDHRSGGRTGVPVGPLLAYFREAGDALDYLHGRGIVHRDVKPGNLLRLDGHAKLSDFGLARLRESQVLNATFCATPIYMAPEVWEGKAIDRSDQYSLAITWCELRVGQRPFRGNSPYDLCREHLRAMPELTGLNPREAEVLRKALSKTPGERYSSCGSFVEALAKSFLPTKLAPAPLPAIRKPKRFSRRWALMVFVLAALLVLILALLLASPRGTDGANEPKPASGQESGGEP